MSKTEFKYLNRPIFKIESLARHLGTTVPNLERLAVHSDSYYRKLERTKINGKTRICYSVEWPLKPIVKKIRERILVKVNYPHYLHGSIKGRSTKTNAQSHIGARCLIELDIADFFPSISVHQVREIFRYFYNFSDEVSTILAILTTYKGHLPQGSPVSSDIANLVLCWDGKETQLVGDLASKNYRYTRYVDDIAISSTEQLTNCEKTEIIRKVATFVKSKDFRIRHRKTQISGPNTVKCVTGIRLGKHSINVRQEYVESVYHEVKQLGFEADLADERIPSIIGKINYIKQFDEKQAIRLENTLRLNSCVA